MFFPRTWAEHFWQNIFHKRCDFPKYGDKFVPINIKKHFFQKITASIQSLLLENALSLTTVVQQSYLNHHSYNSQCNAFSTVIFHIKKLKDRKFKVCSLLSFVSDNFAQSYTQSETVLSHTFDKAEDKVEYRVDKKEVDNTDED